MKKFSPYIDLFRGLVPPVEEWEMRTMHCSMAIYKSRIIAVGFNSKRSHPANLINRKINRSGIDYSNGAFLCSEYACLNRVRRKTNVPFNKIDLLNFRIDRNGNLGLARPCIGCSSLIAFISPKSVFYTNNEGQFQKY